MGSIMAVAENYPDLKASENFQQLQRALNEVEERIGAARRAFNAAVTDYNNAVTVFPLSIVASMAGMQPHAWFQADAQSRERPNVGATQAA
jgi:LemA protein